MPELILLLAFVTSLFFLKLKRKKYEFALAARIGMSAMLVVTSVAHFAFSKGMAMMIPGFIPFKLEFVYLTGVLEMLAAIGLCFPKFRVVTARWLIIFFILLLPANINQSINHIDLEHAAYNGKGPEYLWLRVPLQLFFIAWIYFSAIRRPREKKIRLRSANCQFGMIVRQVV